MEKVASGNPLLGIRYALFFSEYPREYFYHFHFPFLKIHSREHYRHLFQRDAQFTLQVLFSTYDESKYQKNNEHSKPTSEQ